MAPTPNDDYFNASLNGNNPLHEMPTSGVETEKIGIHKDECKFISTFEFSYYNDFLKQQF